MFFGSLATLEGRIDELPDRLRNHWRGAVFTNWKIWIPAQVLNFGFVPLQYQVLFANVVALVWNTYLSWVTHVHVVEDADDVANDAESEPAAETKP